MSNVTSSSTNLTSGEIILISTTLITGLISLLDLAVNTYIGVKKRHFTSSCCKGICSCAYDSESELPK